MNNYILLGYAMGTIINGFIFYILLTIFFDNDKK